MKKFLIIILAIFIITGCRPESRSEETNKDLDKDANIENNETMTVKEYKLRLKEFSIEEVMKLLTPNDTILETSEPEYGKRYKTETAEYVVGNGVLEYYSQRSKYQTYYLFSNTQIFGKEINDEGIKKCTEFLKNIGLSNLRANGYHKATVDDIIKVINNGNDILVQKDGSEVNLREHLKDIEIYRFEKVLDNIPLLDSPKYSLANDKNIITAQAFIIVDNEGVSMVKMNFIPEDIIETKDVKIISKEKAEEFLREDFNKSIQSTELKVNSIDLNYVSEKVEMIKLLQTSDLIYKPIYLVGIQSEAKKGEEVEKFNEYLYIDAITGEIIR